MREKLSGPGAGKATGTDGRARATGDYLFEVAAAHQPQLRTHTLFTTGDVTERAHEMLAACGCPVLQKPFDLGELLTLVGRLTGRLRNATA